MNILVIAHFQNDCSPCACFVHDQVKALQRLGHQIRIIVPIAFGKKDYYGKKCLPILKKDCIDGIWYFYLRYFSLSKYGRRKFNCKNAILSLKILLTKIQDDFYPDIIHAHTLGIDSEMGKWLKFFFNCPLVITTHGSDSVILFQERKYEKIRQLCNNADTVVCVANHLKEKLLYAGVNIRLLVIPNGFNSQFLTRKIKKIPNSLIQVGNLIPSKRNEITIRAFAEIKRKCPTATLTIVGDGLEKEKLLSICKELDIEDAVLFTGQINNEQVLQKMAAAEYFVMVSAPEGLGIVYLEAMASRCLTLAAENQGISDIITSGKNGFLLPLDNAHAIASTILWAMKHKEIKDIITMQAYETAINYDWSANADNYENLFDELIKGYSGNV